jgi:thioesterase domain-containing protein
MKLRWIPWYLESKVRGRGAGGQIESAATAEHEFRTEAITAAFMRAVASYTPEPYDGALHLYRPKLNQAYKVTGARYIDYQYNFQVADNGWTPFVPELTVREVPGDHDSMVLEPNVRVLAAHVVDDIAAVEASFVGSARPDEALREVPS